MADTGQRKVDHLEPCASDEVALRARTTRLECGSAGASKLARARQREIDTSVTLFGKRLRAPLIIAAMTGGIERAAAVNCELSAIARRAATAWLGSRRVMKRSPERRGTNEVRANRRPP
jgi:isopentenyl-diphosphate delta-isomerase